MEYVYPDGDLESLFRSFSFLTGASPLNFSVQLDHDPAPQLLMLCIVGSEGTAASMDRAILSEHMLQP